MQRSAWQWLFNQVPPERQNQLMLVTGSGKDIAVQMVLRIEPDFVAIKGRLAGSTDAGRVFFIPYASIDYFGIQADVKEEEFDTIFGVGPLTAAFAPAALTPPPVSAEAPTPLPAAPAAEAPPAAAASQKTPLPLKSEVLERFRSRIAANSLSPNGTTFRPSVE